MNIPFLSLKDVTALHGAEMDARGQVCDMGEGGLTKAEV